MTLSRAGTQPFFIQWSQVHRSLIHCVPLYLGPEYCCKLTTNHEDASFVGNDGALEDF